ncbi:tRNA (adenosine(37)-N6)-threonylcarbamoyltransferase complex dimerization subunit type 1 TsaB [Nakamurella flava]|uniref:tRNA (Adenosine(37)-N6)-threonylcarbamoyltransferase complex dimerization subunit type 1 TsaB n=1 Tax=Nakamurella flava TaxID=2576308 RepID=A0A4U6QER3_9ACTN|nr:tRNA (adenosine(37)-N6)-threonylcarbamoyltransferase complex dimerization subunit type 1 TsaB [Nakamurella flava]TKV58737.1 tRNA (adenosine(37)-N6)-threonylcarbamoyltransferase complex dimerization subunit type 1 TsaB [Nakamurella flava]
MLVIALDTSTPTVTAAVVELLRPHELTGAAAEPVRLLAEHTHTDPFAHAEYLMPLVDGAVADAGRTLRDVDAVVVGLGPGPFTGLRVGIATASALADGLGCEAHGVPSHDAIARRVPDRSGGLLVATDARRREVYVSAYGPDGRRTFGPAVLAPAVVGGELAAAGIAVGAVTGAGAELLATALPDLPFRSPERALGLGLVERAAPALLTGAVPGPLTPLYLRRPDATEPSARRSVLGPAGPAR